MLCVSVKHHTTTAVSPSRDSCERSGSIPLRSVGVLGAVIGHRSRQMVPTELLVVGPLVAMLCMGIKNE